MLTVVYGTLKRGYGNNRILRNAIFVDSGIVRGFKLYDSNFPVAAPSEGDSISVEVFDIGDPATDDTARITLSNLDALEGYREGDTRSMYYRNSVTVWADNGEVLEGQMFVGNFLFWRNFENMREIPKDVNGVYFWSR